MMKKHTILSFAVGALFIAVSCCPSVHAQEGFIGEIKMFGGNFAPRNWAFCEGQLLAISQNQALFSILGTTYGGDGRTTFALPDFRGRVSIQQGTGSGLPTYSLGQRGGTPTVTLAVSELPSHTHSATAQLHATTTDGNHTRPATNSFLANDPREDQYSDSSVSNVTMNAAAVTVVNGNSGGGQAHNNQPPYLAVNYIICTAGTFPSRN